MDQLKEILAQAAKHRFWIAVGLASILPLIAYFVGTGALAEEEKKETTAIKGAHDGAKGYVTKTIENGQWKQEVENRTAVLTKDVNRSHVKLYNVQAPLLTWPDAVANTIQAWGPQVPEGVDPVAISDAKIAYIQAYPDAVEEVYRSFRPFDFDNGKGIVVAAPKRVLLRPETFKESSLPTLTEIWTAQRKLWIQRTMLDIVAKVNARAKAKTWDDAPVKQILSMQVANEYAVDQVATAKGEGTLENPPPIKGETVAEGSTTAPATGAAGSRGSSEAAGVGFAGAGAQDTGSEPIQFAKSPNPDQYYVVPVSMDVLVEQDRLNDFLVEFRNSPMSIRVLDFEWTKPLKPVKKPRKGEDGGALAGGGIGRGMGGGGGLLGDEMSPAGGGGGMGMSMGAGYANPGAAYGASMKSGSRSAMQGGGPNSKGGGTAREGGKDVKAENLAKLQGKGKKKSEKGKDEEKADDDDEDTSLNPYFNVVHVTIKGQARFYQTPPKVEEPANAASPGPAEPAKDAAPAASGAAPKDAPAPAPIPAPAPADAAKAAPVPPADAKAGEAKDATKADAKADTPKGDATAEPAKETPKGEAAKDAPKGEPAKSDPAPTKPAAEAPKGDAPKAPAGDTPKAPDAQPKR